MSETSSFSPVVTGMKPGVAARRIASFEKRFGKAHLYFTYHAALAVALTPDLLYRLWLNFQQDIHGQVLNIPWIAVADLLLSGLCDEVGYELYEMDIQVRTQLLNRLKKDENFGQERIKQLSNFLISYVHQQLHSDDPDIRDFAEAQWLTALAYTRPRQAAHKLALIFANLNHEEKAELVRMASLVETLAEPLSDQFQALLVYAQGMGIFARGDLERATTILGELVEPGNDIRIAGVSLPIPKQVKANLDALLLAAQKNYRRANLRGRSFKGQNLTGADFSHSDIQGADFTNATLIGANFSHATTGLQRCWAIALLFCSLLLSALSGVSLTIIGLALQNFLFDRNETTFLFALFSLIMFIVFYIAIISQGIEATIGSIALAIVGILALVLVVIFSGVWSWIGGIGFTLSGILILIAAGAAADNGAFGFLGVWSRLLTVGAGLFLVFFCFSVISLVINGVPRGFPDWVLDAAWTFAVPLIGLAAVGVTLVEALAWILAGAVSEAWAGAIGFVWGLAWIVALILTLFTEVGTAAAVAILFVAAPGAYIGWYALLGNDKYSFVWRAAVFFIARGTSFKGANLTDANFTQATLKNADFRKANLTRTNWFRTKKLYQTNFGESYLKHSQVRKLLITRMGQGKNLDRISLRGLNLSGANLADASFIGTDLRETNLQDSDLSRAKLVQTQLDQADLTGACLTGACIQDWNITSSTKLDGVECEYVYMRLPTKENPDPCRQPANHNEIFELGELADFIYMS